MTSAKLAVPSLARRTSCHGLHQKPGTAVVPTISAGPLAEAAVAAEGGKGRAALVARAVVGHVLAGVVAVLGGPLAAAVGAKQLVTPRVRRLFCDPPLRAPHPRRAPWACTKACGP